MSQEQVIQCECGTYIKIATPDSGSPLLCPKCGVKHVMPTKQYASIDPVQNSASETSAAESSVPPQKPIEGTIEIAHKKSGGSALWIALPILLVVFMCCLIPVGFFALGLYGVNQAITQVVAQLGEFTKEYEDKGYVKKMGQVFVEKDDIEEKRVYLAQVVTLKGDVKTDIAIMAQVAVIEGTVEGNLDFAGQSLTVKKGALVKGDVNIKQAQAVVIEGEVEGEVSGSYQVLRNQGQESVQIPGINLDSLDVPDAH